MSAEQHTHSSAESLFTLDRSYKRPRPSLMGRAELLRDRLKNYSVKQFDLAYSFASANELVQQYGKDRGLFLCALGAMMNILTIRQEMLGSMDTQEIVTQILPDDHGSFSIRSTHYAQAKSIENETLFEETPRPFRSRFKLEVDQVKKLFRTLVSQAKNVDFSLPPPQIEKELLGLGFQKQKLTLTPEMLATIPSLIQQVQTIDDFHALLAQKKTINVYVGPSQAITVSPPSWLHRKEDTSLIWGAELCVLQDSGEILIRQKGKFSQAKEETLLQFLEYKQTAPRIFSSEEDFMLFVNLVQQETYCQPHQLLEIIIQQIGELTTVPKIDPNVVLGDLDLRDYFPYIYDLFCFEYEQAQTHQQLSAAKNDRFTILSDLIKHQIARNEPKALASIIGEYKNAYSDKTQVFKNKIQSVALGVDTGFMTRINFGLLDCVLGTPSSLMNAGSRIPHLDTQFGVGSVETIKHYHENGLRSHEELVSFCSRFGKNPDLYSARGVCRMCHKSTYIWPTEHGGCNVCPVCEFMDTEKIPEESLRNYQSQASSENEDSGSFSSRHSRTRIGVSDFITSMATPKAIYGD